MKAISSLVVRSPCLMATNPYDRKKRLGSYINILQLSNWPKGIFFPKLFCPYVRKNVLVIEKNVRNWRLKANREFAKILELIEQFLVTECCY